MTASGSGCEHVVQMFDYCVTDTDIKLVLELGDESLNTWLFPR